MILGLEREGGTSDSYGVSCADIFWEWVLNDYPGGLTQRDGAESRKMKCVRDAAL